MGKRKRSPFVFFQFSLSLSPFFFLLFSHLSRSLSVCHLPSRPVLSLEEAPELTYTASTNTNTQQKPEAE